MNAPSLDMAAAEALFAFWRDAGVDACFEDEPVDRTIFVAPVAAKGPATITPLRATGARPAGFARGNPQGSLMIIGEGPGAEEDVRGQPFVGQAGQLLDRILTAAGLLDDAFITNTVFWKTPGNRTPTPQEQAVCAPFVERAATLLKPKAVLLVGAAAAKAVLKTDDGIMRMRGQWREWRLSEGEIAPPVIATLHPAFLLRQPQAKGLVWKDILDLSVRLRSEVVEPGA